MYAGKCSPPPHMSKDAVLMSLPVFPTTVYGASVIKIVSIKSLIFIINQTVHHHQTIPLTRAMFKPLPTLFLTPLINLKRGRTDRCKSRTTSILTITFYLQLF